MTQRWTRRGAVAALAAAAVCAPFDVARAWRRGEVDFSRRYTQGTYGEVHWLIARPTGNRRPRRPPLVLLHPTAQAGGYFELFMAELATDRVILAPDTPGYGASERPAAPPDSIAAYAEAIRVALEPLLKDLRARQYDLGGYHTGTFLSTELALLDPRRVRRLLLCAIPYYEAGARREQVLERIARPKPVTADIASIADAWRFHVAERPAGVTLERGLEAFWTPLRAEPHHEWAFRALFRYPAEVQLPRVQQPVGILSTHNSIRQQTLDAAKLFPNARTIDIPELQHGAFDVGARLLARHSRALLDEWNGRDP